MEKRAEELTEEDIDNIYQGFRERREIWVAETQRAKRTKTRRRVSQGTKRKKSSKPTLDLDLELDLPDELK